MRGGQNGRIGYKDVRVEYSCHAFVVCATKDLSTAFTNENPRRRGEAATTLSPPTEGGDSNLISRMLCVFSVKVTCMHR